MKLIAVLTTTDNEAEARTIAAALVERRLVACAQISTIESVYNWEGKVQQEREYRLLLKTTADRYADVEGAILELHSYELPAIYAFAMEHAYEPYSEWVAANSIKPD